MRLLWTVVAIIISSWCSNLWIIYIYSACSVEHKSWRYRPWRIWQVITIHVLQVICMWYRLNTLIMHITHQSVYIIQLSHSHFTIHLMALTSCCCIWVVEIEMWRCWYPAILMKVWLLRWVVYRWSGLESRLWNVIIFHL